MKQVMCLLLLLLILCSACCKPGESSREYANYVIDHLPASDGISQQPEVFSHATHKVYANFANDVEGGIWWLTAYLVDFDVSDGTLILRDFYIEARPGGFTKTNDDEMVYVHVTNTYYLSEFYDIVPIGNGQ